MRICFRCNRVCRWALESRISRKAERAFERAANAYRRGDSRARALTDHALRLENIRLRIVRQEQWP